LAVVSQFIQFGQVVGSHGTAGGPASGISYDFLLWTIGNSDTVTITNRVPRRDVPTDMEVTTLAPNGWPASRSVLNGQDFIVLWPGGEQYGTEECP
jgi:hypothetical protein